MYVLFRFYKKKIWAFQVHLLYVFLGSLEVPVCVENNLSGKTHFKTLYLSDAVLCLRGISCLKSGGVQTLLNQTQVGFYGDWPHPPGGLHGDWPHPRSPTGYRKGFVLFECN